MAHAQFWDTKLNPCIRASTSNWENDQLYQDAALAVGVTSTQRRENTRTDRTVKTKNLL